MRYKIFLLTIVLFLICLSEPSSAIDFKDTLLATYELNEVNDLNVSSNPDFSPNLNITWPVLGGVNNVPEATEGDYLLMLDWMNEIDNKIEVGHYWSNSTFDFVDVNYIVVDVFFDAESALPFPENKNISIWSEWDSSAHWISCEYVPKITKEWYTLSFYVGNLDYEVVNNIDALAFEDMNGTDGTIYIDNLRLQPEMDWPYIRRKIKFSGYWWSLLHSDWPIGAGPNYYTDDPNDIWVDPNGHLNLSIIDKDPNWNCSEAVANENLGYGTYVFTLRDEVNSLDPNIVLGLFIYDVPDQWGNHREIDIEFSRWGDPNDPNFVQYVVQPWPHPGNIHRFRIDYTADTETTTHEITWLPDQIDFRSYYGDPPLKDTQDIIETWSYRNIDDIPLPGTENPRINFYLMDGDPPQNGQDAEVVIKTFRHWPNIPAYIDIKPKTLKLAGKSSQVSFNIKLGEGYNVSDIDPCCIFLEEKLKPERFSINERRQTATAKFNGSGVQEILLERGELGEVELTIRGRLSDGTRFKGQDTVKVIRGKKGKK